MQVNNSGLFDKSKKSFRSNTRNFNASKITCKPVKTYNFINSRSSKAAVLDSTNS